MRTLRNLGSSDFEAWFPVVDGAYPSFSMPRDQKQEYFERVLNSPDMDWVGCFDGDVMQGCYRPHYFQSNLFGRIVPTAGLGGVAVDLRHKRRGVARDMINHFHADMRARGYGLASLYPFRPSFYRAVGYGWGTRMYRYQIRPAAIRAAAGNAVIDHMDQGNAGEVLTYLNRRAGDCHGGILRGTDLVSQATALKRGKMLAFRRNGEITAAMSYGFINVDASNDFSYDMEVYALYWDSPADLGELMAFIGGQRDQVRYAFINTGREDFIYLLNNIGVEGGDNVLWEFIGAGAVAWGMMYRILDPAALIEQTAYRNYNNATLTVALDLTDATIPDNNRRWMLRFGEGRLSLDDAAAPDVTLAMDVADFSSLWMGCVSLRRLMEYGVAAVDVPEHIGDLDALFAVPEKPFNTVIF